MSRLDIESQRERIMTAFTVAVTLLAITLTAALVVAERDVWKAETDWIIFGIFGVLLFLAETRPNFTMKFGDDGVISPGWTFTYALVLFGMPLGALFVLLTATLVASVHDRKPIKILILNLGVLTASMTAGVLVLHAFGMRGAMTDLDTIPLQWALAILLGACSMLVLNGLLIAIAIGIKTGSNLVTTLRSGLAVTMTADGALLSLAPVFVIAIDYSFVLVPLLASTSYLVIQSARKSLQRAHDASHDPLTALLNRRAFNDRLGHVLGLDGGAQEAAVLVMDFDRFKEINDSLGHAVGDALLIGFAQRLMAEIPPTASAARLGGDEFAVLIPGAHTHEEFMAMIRRLHTALVQPYEIEGFPLTMAASVGVAFAPLDGSNGDDVIAAADLAMYRAKQFDSRIEFSQLAVDLPRRSTHPGRISLLGELRRAIAHGELVNHYQVEIDVATGVTDTVESLVRWNHPEHGVINPGEFIGMAEQTDLIDALTEDVLRRSMSDMLSIGLPDLSLAVNVSARSLHNRTFPATVISLADEVGFPLDHLELEITERAIASDPAWMSLTVGRLRDAGIRIAIDDFGTGYSSFASLRQIPADRLKIDQSFTRHLPTSPEDRLIVSTIVALGRGLGMDVVAEGVETCEIWQEAIALGCDFLQGYAIARPIPAHELRATIQSLRSHDRERVLS